ncbi:MAG: hypothetical protein JGK17_12840 [Microcoleus sp. PH2017_10_PVI_O_A]|uniref:hypothetical protein n=1 Tax=unclassified Microcoleus TaxID=2642155 RepID=UPI001D540EE0|nr:MULTISPECIES: hypothetical protein [unclassified Microcoleus]TAE82201.1 MAG: hypothetical protein EAZ83_12915 [Oscillatoriales cyanobacterium]MCC3406451.1 hypothetical protein [Microcoleus sp. PH2017_10_PVI_O_A]MCC3459078.1 hypothetical protein [Microcoleus sp. PH2017_11_PCY_U_A]MCC3478970.1 hypothetical protein [Microcoleus sp. PH2017_12_PCY_D_A]MCC3529221.1 hypothetical protein [Microcoleus sp. PH2017_21_RUC_O_A]
MKVKQQSLLIAASVLGILIPASYILYLISQAGDLSNFDYWWMTWNFYSVDGFSTNPFNWIFRANEHFVFIPAIIYALNIVVTQGSNIGLCLVAWFFAWIQCYVLIALLPLRLRSFPLQFISVILCISIFNFTPAAAHNWMRGFSGVHWIIANLFVICSIFCLQSYVNLLLNSREAEPLGIHSQAEIGNEEWEQNKWVIGSIVFGILGCISYSTPLGLWPILCGAAIVLRFPRRITYLYFAASIAVIGIYFLTYKTPSNHPSLTKINPLKTLEYIPIYLGGIFSENIIVASIIGIIGLIAVTGFVGYWLLAKKSVQLGYPVGNRQNWLPWLSIQLYTLQTALMAAVSRSGFGVEQATASRYATLPALFWMSTIVLIVLAVRELQPTPRIQGRWLTPVFAVVTAAVILMYGVGGETAMAIARRATYQPLVALSLQLGITDITLIKERVGNKPAAFVGLIDALKTNNLVPFNRDIKKHNFCAALDTKIDPNLLSAPKDGVPGYFDTVTQLAPQAARVIGWVGDPENHVKCIVILNQENVVRGFAMSGFPRPDLVNLFGASYKSAAWRGYIQTSPTDKLLTAYASFKNREGWVALRNSQVINQDDSVKTDPP